MKTKFRWLLACLFFAPAVISADPVLDALHKISKYISDPDTGMKVTNTKLQKQAAATFLSLLRADLHWLAIFIQTTENVLLLKEQEIKNRISAFESNPIEMSPANLSVSIERYHELKKIVSDVNTLKFLQARLQEEKDSFRRVTESECSEPRLAYVLKAFDSSRYLQHQSLSLEGFATQVQDIFKDMAGMSRDGRDTLNYLAQVDRYAADQKRLPGKPFQIGINFGTSFGGGSGGMGPNGSATVGIPGNKLSDVGAGLVVAGANGMIVSAAGTAMFAACTAALVGGAAVLVFVAVKELLLPAIAATQIHNEKLDAISELNRMIRAATPSAEESKRQILEVCAEVSRRQVSADGLTWENSLPFLREPAHSELSKLKERSDLLFANLEPKIRAQLTESPHFSAAELRSAVTASLVESRQKMGEEKILLNRARSQVDSWRNRLGQISAMENLEILRQKKILSILLKNEIPSISDSQPELMEALKQ